MSQLSLRLPPPRQFLDNARAKLSPRETEVISCLADGQTWKECAAVLGISERTVRAYVENIRRKLGVPNTSAAILLLCR
jgi:DNA-binding CsgD family transcriptional regulator